MSLLSSFVRSNSFFNVSREHVSMFILEKEEKAQKGDFIVVNTRTLQARKPTESSGYFSVGIAKRVLELADGKQAVICVDGYHIFYDPDGNISESDAGKDCYFLNGHTITTDNINKTKAGVIANIEVSDDPIDIEDGANRIIWVKIDLTEGSDLEW